MRPHDAEAQTAREACHECLHLFSRMCRTLHQLRRPWVPPSRFERHLLHSTATLRKLVAQIDQELPGAAEREEAYRLLARPLAQVCEDLAGHLRKHEGLA